MTICFCKACPGLFDVAVRRFTFCDCHFALVLFDIHKSIVPGSAYTTGTGIEKCIY